MIAKEKSRRPVTLTKPLAQFIDAQVKAGRYGSFSDAIQEAAWAFFMGDDLLQHPQKRQEILDSFYEAKAR